MLGETQEYEPLSRAAYYKAILNKKQKNEKKENSSDTETSSSNYE